jgi:thiamine biosynthesis lipoprotein ApbE
MTHAVTASPPTLARRLPRVLLAALPILLPGLVEAEWHQRDEPIMGTRVAVELWSEDAALATRAMDAVIAEMRRTDELMSTYKPESQLSQVNARATSGRSWWTRTSSRWWSAGSRCRT